MRYRFTPASITACSLLIALLLSACGGDIDFGIGGGGGGGGGGSGQTRVSAVTVSNRLVTFNQDVPGTLLSSSPITGLQAGESILGIDFRPATGKLYGLGSSSRLYMINSLGVATAVNATPFAVPLSGSDFGFDFNPAVDRIRVVSDTGQNMRLNPNDGTVVDGDTVTAGTQPDTALTPSAPNVAGIAYDRNFSTAGVPGTTASVTTLFGIDFDTDTLVRQGGVDGDPSPDLGVLTAIGALGVNTNFNVGFDVSSVNRGSSANPLGLGIAALQPVGSTTSTLYSINLTTGAATVIGAIGGSEAVRDIAIPPASPVVAFVVTSDGMLVRFSPSTPGTQIGSTALSGLTAGDVIRGIDFRPATEDLVAIASGAAPAGSARVYRIHPTTAVATLLNTLIADPADATLPYAAVTGGFFGVDFNPASDRLRVVSDSSENLRINVDDGRTITDTTLNGLAGATVVASAYTNNIAGASASSTRLFGIDTSVSPNRLVEQSPPNDGTLATVGTNLGVGISSLDDNVGFDIVGGGRGLALATINTGAAVSNLYRINLDTGVAVQVGGVPINVGGAAVVTGFALRLQEP